MRILIKLRSLKDCAYDKKYYDKLRGFIYQFQKDSKYFNKHDNAGYKLYSFSNIFPAEDTKVGDIRHLIISSPDKDFIEWMYGRLSRILENNKTANIGEMQFKIEDVAFIEPKIKNNIRLITGTPIIVRIPKNKYKEYGIESSRPYEYWRPEYDFNAFVKQLSENLIKKYSQYCSKDVNLDNIFEIFKFKKSVCVHRIENGKEQNTIGSLWEFQFNYLNNEQKKILQIGLESGFGELNSSGFGFMNIIKINYREKHLCRKQQVNLDEIPVKQKWKNISL